MWTLALSLTSTSEMLWPVRTRDAEGAAGAASILGMMSLLIGVNGSNVISNCSTQKEKQDGMYNTVKLRGTCLPLQGDQATEADNTHACSGLQLTSVQ